MLRAWPSASHAVVEVETAAGFEEEEETMNGPQPRSGRLVGEPVPWGRSAADIGDAWQTGAAVPLASEGWSAAFDSALVYPDDDRETFEPKTFEFILYLI